MRIYLLYTATMGFTDIQQKFCSSVSSDWDSHSAADINMAPTALPRQDILCPHCCTWMNHGRMRHAWCHTRANHMGTLMSNLAHIKVVLNSILMLRHLATWYETCNTEVPTFLQATVSNPGHYCWWTAHFIKLFCSLLGNKAFHLKKKSHER